MDADSVSGRAHQAGVNSFYYKWLYLLEVIDQLEWQTDAMAERDAGLARNCSWMVSYVVDGNATRSSRPDALSAIRRHPL